MDKKPWIMTQEWHDVVFLHWPVRTERIKEFLPTDLEPDQFDGCAWIGVVLFKAEGTRPRFMPPVPGVRSYLELNVRTYVKYKGKPGVYFFSLDADSLVAVITATRGGFLPYRHARMHTEKRGEARDFQSRRIHRNSYPERIDLSYRISSGTIHRTALEYWLTERYCLWTKPGKQLIRVDIDHSPWNLQYVSGEIRRNSMASFLSEDLHSKRPIAHFGGMKKVRFFPPVIEQ